MGDAEKWVKEALDRKERLMGFGHRVYRAEDPRARVLRRTAKEIGAPRVEVAEALENAALAELKARSPDRVLATNVEFWSAVVLDYAEIPPELFTPLFASRPRRRLERAHPRAEARGAPDPPDGQVRRPGAARAARRDRRPSAAALAAHADLGALRAAPVRRRASPCARRASTRASSTASPGRSALRTSRPCARLRRRRRTSSAAARGSRTAARGGLHGRATRG